MPITRPLGPEIVRALRNKFAAQNGPKFEGLGHSVYVRAAGSLFFHAKAPRRIAPDISRYHAVMGQFSVEPGQPSSMSTQPTLPHELFQFFHQAATEMQGEYVRIHNRAKEDPGTAGDEGEENWSQFLINWLPATYR